MIAIDDMITIISFIFIIIVLLNTIMTKLYIVKIII